MGPIEQKLDELVALLNEARKDCDKFDRGMNAPSVRIRKVAQKVTKELKVFRSLVVEARKTRSGDKTKVAWNLLGHFWP